MDVRYQYLHTEVTMITLIGGIVFDFLHPSKQETPKRE